MELSDIQGTVSLANVKISEMTPPLCADALVRKFNEIDAALSSKSTISVDEELYKDSYNPIANAPVATALDGKVDKEYEATDSLGEFHSMATNEDGSIIVFGGDECGDAGVRNAAICYSLDGMKSVMRTSVSVNDAKNVIPNCLSVEGRNIWSGEFVSEQPITTYPQWRTVCYSKKAHTFLAAPLVVSYRDTDNKIMRADLVWTSTNGKDWNCIVLGTYFDAYVSQRLAKIDYDDDTGITVVPRGDRVFWSEDCVKWNCYTIDKGEDTANFYGTSIDALGNGKFLVWSGQHYTTSNDNGVVVITYDPATKKFSNDTIVRLSDPSKVSKGYSMIPCSSVANGVGIASMFGISNGAINLFKYDIEAKELVVFQDFTTSWVNETRDTFAHGNSIYVMTRTPRGLLKITITDGEDSKKAISVEQVFTGRSDKFESACIVDDKFYIAGRTSYGIIFEFDPEAKTLTPVDYNRIVPVSYVKKSNVTKLTPITNADNATLSAMINTIISSFNKLEN